MCNNIKFCIISKGELPSRKIIHKNSEVNMSLKILNYEFVVCKVRDYSLIDISHPFVFTGSTDEEYSHVCPAELAPKNMTECESGWRAFRIEGVLDFSLIGIIAEISTILAENKIGIFVVSTYNNDYIFIKSENFERAVNALEGRGYKVN